MTIKLRHIDAEGVTEETLLVYAGDCVDLNLTEHGAGSVRFGPLEQGPLD